MKLIHKYISPYKVLQQINEVTYRLVLPRCSLVSPSFHVFHLNPVIPGPLASNISPCHTPQLSWQHWYLFQTPISRMHCGIQTWLTQTTTPKNHTQVHVYNHLIYRLHSAGFDYHYTS